MVFFILGNGSDLEIPIRLRREGNKVYYWCSPMFRADFDELFNATGVIYLKDEKLPKIPDDVDIIVYTFIGAGSTIDKLKKKYPVIGADSAVQQLELQRDIGKKVAKKIGFNIPENFTSDVKTAIQRIQKEKEPYVIKPHSNLPTYFTGIPESWEDSIEILEDIARKYSSAVVTCERRIFGAEIGIETYFDGEKMLRPFNIGFEFKRAFNGDMGPLTGETGTLMYYGSVRNDIEELMDRFGVVLQNLGYHGDICAGCIVEEDTGDLYFLEWTCFDEETFVFTEHGWKRGWEVNIGEKVLAIDTQTLKTAWQPVIDTFVAKYEGPMISIRGTNDQEFNIMITPEHRLLILRDNNVEIIRADGVNLTDKLITLDGKNLKFIQIKEIKRIQYKGRIWDLEVDNWHTLLVNRKGFSYFSSNCRMGYPEILFQIDLLNIDLGELFYLSVFPQPQWELPVKDAFACGVALMAGGAPFEEAFKKYGLGFRINGLDNIEDDQPVITRVRFEHVSVKNGNVYLGKFDERSIIIAGYGYTAPEAVIDAYKYARHIKATNAYFRTDIGERVIKKDAKILYDFGYIDYDHFKRMYQPEFSVHHFINLF